MMDTAALTVAKIAYLVFALGSSSGASPTAESSLRAQETDISTLPAAVCDALDRAMRVYEQPLKGVQWGKAHRLGAEHSLFQVRGTNRRGNTVETEITAAGRTIEVEEHGIPIDEVPAVVIERLNTRMPRFQPKQIEAIYQIELPKPVAYGFEGEDAGGKKIEIYISTDGKNILN